VISTQIDVLMISTQIDVLIWGENLQELPGLFNGGLYENVEKQF